MIAKRLLLVGLAATNACSAGPQVPLTPSQPAASASLSANSVTDSFIGRDGEAEALASLRNGEPLKLFSHEVNAEVPRYNTPGLLNCDPDQDGAQHIFRPLPEADWSEGNYYTEEQQKRAVSARSFAKEYNLAMFRERRAVILKVCPRAQIR